MGGRHYPATLRAYPGEQEMQRAVMMLAAAQLAGNLEHVPLIFIKYPLLHVSHLFTDTNDGD